LCVCRSNHSTNNDVLVKQYEEKDQQQNYCKGRVFVKVIPIDEFQYDEFQYDEFDFHDDTYIIFICIAKYGNSNRDNYAGKDVKQKHKNKEPLNQVEMDNELEDQQEEGNTHEVYLYT